MAEVVGQPAGEETPGRRGLHLPRGRWSFSNWFLPPPPRPQPDYRILKTAREVLLICSVTTNTGFYRVCFLLDHLKIYVF